MGQKQRIRIYGSIVDQEPLASSPDSAGLDFARLWLYLYPGITKSQAKKPDIYSAVGSSNVFLWWWNNPVWGTGVRYLLAATAERIVFLGTG
jgi:hypothetical protein